MSKAPGSAAEYDGSGDWFKIYDWGPNFNSGQASWTMSGMLYLLSWELVAMYQYTDNINQGATRAPFQSASPPASISCASRALPFITRVLLPSGTSAAAKSLFPEEAARFPRTRLRFPVPSRPRTPVTLPTFTTPASRVTSCRALPFSPARGYIKDQAWLG